MPKMGCKTIIEMKMLCGVEKKFNNNKQSILWEKLHCQKCQRCKNANTREVSLESIINYSSSSSFVNTNEEIQSNRESLINVM